MKKAAFILFVVLGFSNCIFAQKQDHLIPSVDIKKLDGSTFNTANIKNDGKPMIIDFWATWCSPCKAELNAIAEDYADWQTNQYAYDWIATQIDVTIVGDYVPEITTN